VDPGWHPDPYGGASWRYWDGEAWTAHTAPRYNEGFTPVHQLIGRRALLHQQVGGGERPLYADEARVGILDIPFVGDTTAHSAEGSWYLDRRTFSPTTVWIKVLPAKIEIAKFEWASLSMAGGGTLAFADGRQLAFVAGGDETIRRQPGTFGDMSAYAPAQGTWSFARADGSPLVSTELVWPEGKAVRWGTGRTSADIWTEIHPSARGTHELPLLTLLSTFLVWWNVSLREQVSR
jgi:uncharacterized protein DUF2510